MHSVVTFALFLYGIASCVFLQDRLFYSLTDMVCLTIIMSVSPAVREAASTRGPVKGTNSYSRGLVVKTISIVEMSTHV